MPRFAFRSPSAHHSPDFRLLAVMVRYEPEDVKSAPTKRASFVPSLQGERAFASMEIAHGGMACQHV